MALCSRGSGKSGSFCYCRCRSGKIPLSSHLKQLLLRTGLPDPYTLFVLHILSRSHILHGLQSCNVYHAVPIGEFNGLMSTFGQNLHSLNLTMPLFCIGNHKVCPVKSRVITLTYLALFLVWHILLQISRIFQALDLHICR